MAKTISERESIRPTRYHASSAFVRSFGPDLESFWKMLPEKLNQPPIDETGAFSSYALPAESGHPGLYVSVYHPASRLKRALQSGRFSRGAHAFRVARFLLKQNVPAPRPLAYASFRSGSGSRESVYLSHYMSGARPLDEVLPAASAADRFILVERYGALMGRVHRVGLYVPNLEPRAVFVVGDTARNAQLYLVRHADTRFYLGWMRPLRLRSLASAYFAAASREFSDAERLRFLEGYLSERNGSAPERDMINELRDRLERLYRKHVARCTKNSVTPPDKVFAR